MSSATSRRRPAYQLTLPIRLGSSFGTNSQLVTSQNFLNGAQ
jgi:hypothetical protein